MNTWTLTQVDQKNCGFKVSPTVIGEANKVFI